MKQIQGKQGLVRNIRRFGKQRVREIGIPLYMLTGSCTQASLANNKMECQKWPEKPFILEISGNQYVAMVTKLLSSHLVEYYCKESNIPDKNWLRNLFSSYLIKIWLSILRHHLAKLHTAYLKTLNISGTKRDIWK